MTTMNTLEKLWFSSKKGLTHLSGGMGSDARELLVGSQLSALVMALVLAARDDGGRGIAAAVKRRGGRLTTLGLAAASLAAATAVTGTH